MESQNTLVPLSSTTRRYSSKGRLNAKLIQTQFKENHHPLHPCLTPETASVLLSDTDQSQSKTFFISITIPKLSAGSKEAVSSIGISSNVGISKDTPSDTIFSRDNFDDSIICSVHVVEDIDSSEDRPPPGIVHLFCSDTFLKHYNLPTDVFIKRIEVHAVENIVIGVRNFKAFKWMQEVEFCTGLLCQVCESPVLVRSDDVFLAPLPTILTSNDQFSSSFYFDIYVLECAPLRQGILSVNTAMVISYYEESTTTPRLQLDLHNDITDRSSSPLVSDFCQVMRQSSVNEGDTDIDNVNSYFQNGKIKEFDYNLVEQESNWDNLVEKHDESWNSDPNYFIGMSQHDMLDNGLFDGALIMTNISELYEDVSESSNYKIQKRLAVVRCINKKKSKDSTVLISPVLLFNLKHIVTDNQRTVLKIQKYLDKSARFDYESGSRSPSWSSEVPFAKEVQISIVCSPNYSQGSDLSKALEKYFLVPRLVAEGDVIPIKSSDAPEFWNVHSSDTDFYYPIVFFKVSKVISDDSSSTDLGVYRADISSKLLQVGSVHSYVPMHAVSYLTSDKLGYWDSSKLPGLNRYVDRLQSCILPHIQHRLDSPGLNLIHPAILLTGPVGCGKTSVIMAVAISLSMHVKKVNCHSLYGDAMGATETRIKNVFNNANVHSPCILLLQNIHALGKDRDGLSQDPRIANSFINCVKELHLKIDDYPIVIIATTHSTKDISQDLQDIFLHEVQIQAPCESERAEMLQGLVECVNYSGDLSVPHIAQRTAGFVLGDMVALISQALREAYKKICKTCCPNKTRLTIEEEEDILSAGVVLQQSSFILALDKLQAAHSDDIGAPKIPNVTWEDVGGLAEVKSEILDTIQLPLQYPELLAAGLRRSGVLLYGPPGTGKTLMAKAVATECSLNFLSVKGPELINMYVGQSEENVREVFNRARSATPCVIFFDELDSLAPNRGRSGDSGGVMDRIVSQLLAELDGLHKSCDVFVIGATNRPDLLDPALIRPGRFDKMLYLGVSEDHPSQLRILTALTRKFQFADGFLLSDIAEKCPFNLTGADFYALCSDALLNSAKRKIELLKLGKNVDQTQLIVDERDFLMALQALTPSVTEDELLHFKELQKYYNKKD